MSNCKDKAAEAEKIRLQNEEKLRIYLAKQEIEQKIKEVKK
jgi:hypothetical protein